MYLRSLRRLAIRCCALHKSLRHAVQGNRIMTGSDSSLRSARLSERSSCCAVSRDFETGEITMDPNELRDIMEFLRQRVHLEEGDAVGGVVIRFDVPSVSDMEAADLNAEGSQGILDAPWWDEMVTDVIETPEMCEPDDSPEQVLEYARDVVSEYIRKRAAL